MHYAWETDDILHLLFECLDSQDLVRLAQTCNFLFQAVTDRLWRKLKSITPFIHCLPNDYRTRPLGKSDIERLDFYSSKVYEIDLTHGHRSLLILPLEFQKGKAAKVMKKKEKKKRGDTTALAATIAKKSWAELWFEVAAIRPRTSQFLPNLRSLRANHASEALLIPLIGISGSNLTQLYIRYLDQYPDFDGTVPKLLNGLWDTSKLTYLFVRDGGDIVPSKLIRQSPLNKLRLDPKISWNKQGHIQFKRHHLCPEILGKNTLQHLTLGLTRDWYSNDLNIPTSKCLPSLQTLWLNLVGFVSEKCEQSTPGGCRNAYLDSWTCLPKDGPKASDLPDCGRRSPAVLFECFDNPALTLLNIKFPSTATGPMILNLIKTASNNCRLLGLTHLSLSGGDWCNGRCLSCSQSGTWSRAPHPFAKPHEVRQIVQMLLPMPQLKVLRLEIASNFLDILDLELYQTIAAGLPALEHLVLGPYRPSGWDVRSVYEKLSLHHVAAFCSYIPSLLSIRVGSIDCKVLEEQPSSQWTSNGVEQLNISWWIGKDYERGPFNHDVDKRVQAYFPNSDLAKRGVNLWPQC